MIVPESIVTQIVSTIEPLEFNSQTLTPTFHYGNKDELARFLETFKDDVYPLIWMLPSVENHDIAQVSQDVEFILAVNFQKKDRNVLNNKRIDQNFKGLLIPLAEKFMFRIARNKNASYDNKDYRVMKYPNYAETNDDKPDSIHYWDALTLSLKMSFYNNC
jgi:hypothetical protein